MLIISVLAAQGLHESRLRSTESHITSASIDTAETLLLCFKFL